MMKAMRSLLAVATLLAVAALEVHAQGYPKGAINLVIPLAPGDATDIAGRMMAEDMSKTLKVPIVVINRQGAGGTIGVESVAKAAKDGYTVLLANNAAITFRRVLEPQNVPYDPLKDLTPIALTTRVPSIVAIREGAPYKTLGELVEFSKKNPGKVRIGNVGAGSVGEFAIRTINSLTGSDLTPVPFKGGQPAIAAMRGGHVEGVAVALGALAGQLKAGTAHGIVLSTRFPEFPNIPTMVELQHKQNIPGVWFGFFAPAGVSPEVTAALVSAVERATKNPAIAAKLLPLGMVQDYGSPQQLVAEMNEETRMVEQMAKRAGLIK